MKLTKSKVNMRYLRNICITIADNVTKEAMEEATTGDMGLYDMYTSDARSYYEMAELFRGRKAKKAFSIFSGLDTAAKDYVYDYSANNDEDGEYFEAAWELY